MALLITKYKNMKNLNYLLCIFIFSSTNLYGQDCLNPAYFDLLETTGHCCPAFEPCNTGGTHSWNMGDGNTVTDSDLFTYCNVYGSFTPAKLQLVNSKGNSQNHPIIADSMIISEALDSLNEFKSTKHIRTFGYGLSLISGMSQTNQILDFGLNRFVETHRAI